MGTSKDILMDRIKELENEVEKIKSLYQGKQLEAKSLKEKTMIEKFESVLKKEESVISFEVDNISYGFANLSNGLFCAYIREPKVNTTLYRDFFLIETERKEELTTANCLYKLFLTLKEKVEQNIAKAKAEKIEIFSTSFYMLFEDLVMWKLLEEATKKGARGLG